MLYILAIESSDSEFASMAEAARYSKLMDRYYRAAAVGLTSCGEIRPAMVVPVIARNKSGDKACFPMQWGYNNPQRSLLVNARSETAGEKPMFTESWHRHRCIIPASYYFEWEHFLRPNGKKETGNKYLIQPKGGKRTWLCGLYRLEEGLPHFVILTRAPTEEIGFIHDRMPLIIREQDIENWINPDKKAEEIAYRAVTDLYYQKAG